MRPLDQILKDLRAAEQNLTLAQARVGRLRAELKDLQAKVLEVEV
jgi:hypothetical protein